MTVLAQHGFGKGAKLTRALEAGSIGGVVLSPRHESPENLASCLESIAESHPDSVRMVDPQFYATTIVPAKLGRLTEYESWFRPGLGMRDFVSARHVQRFAESVLEFQSALNVTALLTPTLRISGFRDRLAQVVLQLADSSCQWKQAKGERRPLYVSLLVDEAALRGEEELGDFIDLITVLECDGFYIIPFRASETYSEQFEPDALAGLMYLVYVLGELNETKVVCGYTGVWGSMVAATGSSHVATGWFQSLRNFTFRPWRPSEGGRQPRARYTSTPLLDSILISDLDKVFERRVVEKVLSGTSQDLVFRTTSPLQVPWSQETDALHHWASMTNLLGAIPQGSTDERLAFMAKRIDRAEGLFLETRQLGVEYEAPAGNHLPQWSEAIEIFRRRAEI